MTEYTHGPFFEILHGEPIPTFMMDKKETQNYFALYKTSVAEIKWSSQLACRNRFKSDMTETVYPRKKSMFF